MPQKPFVERRLPSREIGYMYTVAMYFAQAFEQNLRAFLYGIDRHGWIDEIQLTDEQRKRFKDSEGFIDKSTCGLLIEKLRNTSTIKSPKAWKIFARACAHRNRLAHDYLMEHDFDSDTSASSEQAITQDLRLMTFELYAALVISQSTRERIEDEADKQEQWWIKFNEELGFPTPENVKRKYIPPSRRRKSNG